MQLILYATIVTDQNIYQMTVNDILYIPLHCEIRSLDKGYFRFRMLFRPDIQKIDWDVFQGTYSLNYRSKLDALKMLQLKNFVIGNLFPKSYMF